MRYTSAQLKKILSAVGAPTDRKSASTRNELALSARVRNLISEDDYRETSTGPMARGPRVESRERSVTAEEIFRGARKRK